jgi:hypothetical protein
MKKTTTRDDWSIFDMPVTYETTFLNKELAAGEYQALLSGFLPRDMDDRWFMYANEGYVYLHRSWTGHCIFRLKIEVKKEGCLLTELRINRDTNQYKSTNVEADKNEVDSILSYLIALKKIEE